MSSPVPSNLRSIITDFTADLSVVFPEYAFMWSKWATESDTEYEKLHAHCLAVYPERFFDIMYTNADIFEAGSKLVVDFLPDVDFRILFNCPGVSEKTKTSIWKYLQLLLMTVLGSLHTARQNKKRTCKGGINTLRGRGRGLVTSLLAIMYLDPQHMYHSPLLARGGAGQDRSMEEGAGHAPGPPDAHDELVLVDAIPILVALELLRVLSHKAEHVVGRYAALLDVLAGGVKPSVGSLGQARLEREQVVRHFGAVGVHARRALIYARSRGSTMAT